MIYFYTRTRVHNSREKDDFMLVAYGPDGRSVIAEETDVEQLQQLSHERALYCPNCRGSVHVRGGPEKRTQLHFAHQRGECAWSTEGESVRHAKGKLVLAHWLREQFPEATVTLEERLPEPNRIADIFVHHADGQRWAVEFQCAPLDIEEWKHRHRAYRTAGILDTWIVGENRCEKQEAFLEAILATAKEILFLDPLSTPARIWLRWPLPRDTAHEWQAQKLATLSLTGWVGRQGYGATLTGQLQEITFDEGACFVHPTRSALEAHTRLLQSIRTTTTLDASLLASYLRHSLDEDALQIVVMPLVRSYVRDPDLLRRYNYGRGLPQQPLTTTDIQRIQKAKTWLTHLEQTGFSSTRLQEILKAIPFLGPYAAFASYMEMLLAL